MFLAGALREPYWSLAIPAYRYFGLAFQPAALALLCGAGLSLTADHIVPALEALPGEWEPLLHAVAHAETSAADRFV